MNVHDVKLVVGCYSKKKSTAFSLILFGVAQGKSTILYGWYDTLLDYIQIIFPTTLFFIYCTYVKVH